jgi:hypothetical protein
VTRESILRDHFRQVRRWHPKHPYRRAVPESALIGRAVRRRNRLLQDKGPVTLPSSNACDMKLRPVTTGTCKNRRKYVWKGVEDA